LNNIEKYRKFCLAENDIPIFSQDWWLDAVCGKTNWDVILIEKDNEIIASMPYFLTKKFVFKMIFMPKLTQTMGCYILYPKGQKYEKKLSYEKDTMNKLIEQLPSVSYFFQNFHYSRDNWLPFYWKGYTQTTRYTYILENLKDLELIFKNFRSNIKTDIRKAEKHINVVESDDLEQFYDIATMTFKRQNKSMPYTYDYLKNIDIACKKNDSRKILFAVDENNDIHAAVYIIWDQNSAYYLISGGNPSLRNSGATSLLVWEAIKFSSTVTLRFDFEGSMVEPIERVFRAFGAKQVGYSRITKANNILLKVVEAFR
jgi:lipid II:glycine glycyltransferase (peptidoglycan interpeptide bridge formation enzyme)